jgi:DNA-binding SARP family transcriptional activator/DNA-binding XRE family transcriptional regulator
MDQSHGGGGQGPWGNDRRPAAGGLGALIADCRRSAGLTQRELAMRAGVGLGTVRDLEQGRSPGSRSLTRLAAVLDLDAAKARASAGAAGEPGAAHQARRPGGMWLAVLGPLEAWRNGTKVELGPRRQRALLGLLAVSPGELVSRACVIDALWGEEPPATAVHLVQAHVSRLRKVLDPDRPAVAGRGPLESVGTSYRLRASADGLDLLAFGRMAGRARAALSAGDAATACSLYENALDLWRGSPLADLDLLQGHLAVTHLAGRRAAVVMEYAQAAAAAYRLERALPRLEALARTEPLNERAAALLMTALAAAGRQAAALRVYDDLRHRLDEQLGVRPGAELAEAHLRVVRQEIQGGQLRPHAGAGSQAGALAPASLIPRQLPPAMPHFTGRARELAALTSLLGSLPAGTGTPAAVVISAIGGTAGIGKTTLAVRWAHEVAGRFPDGQLYVNLRGYHPAEGPVDAGQAIRGFLEALGMPVSRIPATLEAQIVLYRSMIAGRRMLIVLDNARDAEHARPLLPGSAGCLVIITSRSQLAGLVAVEGAHLLNLELLSGAEARELLCRRLGPERVAAELDAASDLAKLCAGLPLALSIVAARAAARPSHPLAAFAVELSDDHALLDALDAGDARASVRAVFSWSLANLTGAAAQMFRLLGVHPGPDISTAAAAALAGIPRSQVCRLLNELTSLHVLTEHSPGRFTLHDLLRAYSIEQGRARDSASDRQAALRRVLDFYLHTAYKAALLLNPARDIPAAARPLSRAVPAAPDDGPSALAWFEAEHAVLVAAVARAAEAGFGYHVDGIAWSMADYFDRRGHWHDWAATQRLAVAAASRAGDLAVRAQAHRGLGRAATELRSYQEAHEQFSRAVVLYRRLGDTVGEGRTQIALARVREYQNEHDLALGHCEQALALFLAAGHRLGQASARNAVGWHQAHLGNFAQALVNCQQALALYRVLGDSRGEAAASDSLGYAHHLAGNPAEARRCYHAAVALFRSLGDRYQQAGSLARLGDVYHDDRDVTAAQAHWREAVDILDGLAHPDAAEVRAKLHGRAAP